MASYVAAYRIGMLVSTAGALFLVSAIQAYGFDKQAAWHWGYVAMAVLVLIGTATALLATEPERSARGRGRARRAEAVRARGRGRRRRLQGFPRATRWPSSMLAFVVLFKFTDALSGAMTAPFVIDLGFTRNEYAAIVKGVGLAALLARRLCRRLRGARAAACDQPVDRRHPAGGGQSRLLLGGRSSATTSPRWPSPSRWRISPAPSAR